jgi:hypothetical protein
MKKVNYLFFFLMKTKEFERYNISLHAFQQFSKNLPRHFEAGI